MSEEEQFIETIEKIDKDDLEEITIEEVRLKTPKVFMKPTDEEPDVAFSFLLNDISKVKVIPKTKTKVGTDDMYLLDTEPAIYCFRNAYDQLEKFISTNNIKLPSIINYVTRKGSDYTTQYIFEKGKK